MIIILFIIIIMVLMVDGDDSVDMPFMPDLWEVPSYVYPKVINQAATLTSLQYWVGLND